MSSLKVLFSENTEEEKPIFKQCSIENCKKIGKYFDAIDKKLLCEEHSKGLKSCIQIRIICKKTLCDKQALYGSKKKPEDIKRCENHKNASRIKCSDEVINQAYEEYKKILSEIGGSNINYDTHYDTYGSGYDTEKDLKIKDKISPNIRKRQENNLSPLKNRNNSSPNIRKRQENNLSPLKNIINFKKEVIKTLKLYKPLNCNLHLSNHAIVRCYERNINIYQIYYEIHNVDSDFKKIYETCVKEKEHQVLKLLTIKIVVAKVSENKYILITVVPLNENYELDNPPVKETGIQTDHEFYDIVEIFKNMKKKKKSKSLLKKKDISTNTEEKHMDTKCIQTDHVFEENYNKEISTIFFSSYYSLKNRNREIIFTLYSQSIMLCASGGVLYSNSNNARVFHDIDVEKIYTDSRDEILRYFLYNNSTFFDAMATSMEKLIYINSLPWNKN
jgi:hypothetical protein